jgi:hypothetical protein
MSSFGYCQKFYEKRERKMKITNRDSDPQRNRPALRRALQWPILAHDDFLLQPY